MTSYRKRLLGSTVTTIIGSVALIAPQAASATCTVAAGVVTCATTNTTNTPNLGGSPAVDRNYSADTSTAAFTGTVSTGAVVDGFGLSFTNTITGANALNVVNNGTVQINAGNNASAGGGSVLQVNAFGTTPVVYSGEGNVINLGTLTGHGLDFFMQGSGSLTATVGIAGGPATTISSAAPGAAAIQVNRLSGTIGGVTITTTSDTTLRADLAGINIDASGSGTMTVVNNATIGSLLTAPNTLDLGIRVVENGTGTGAIAITNNGAIGTAGDRVIDGIATSINNAASTANVTVLGSATGTIFSTADAIEAYNNGTGALIVNYLGALNSSNGSGISTIATSGTATITSGAITAGNGSGVNVAATTGNIIANVNGNITSTDQGLFLSSAGTKTIVVGAGVTINSTGDSDIEVTGAGATSITNNGTIGANTADIAIFTTNFADGAVTIANGTGATINGALDLTNNDDTLNNNGIFNAGSVTTFLYGGNDAINNNANGIINLNGALNFGFGTDTLSNTGLATINILGSSSLLGLETFTQNGRLNLNNFVLAGSPIAFVNGASGIVDTSGSASLLSFTSITNNGIFDLAAGTFTVPVGTPFVNNGTIFADEGVTTINAQASFANSGTLDLQDNANGDILTITSSYAGIGNARLQVDTTTTTADILVITGAITGTTFIDVNAIGNGFIDPLGVLVVDGLSSTADAFLIGNQSGSPLINYDVRQSGSDYFLVAGPSAAAFQPLILAAAASDMWYQSADEVIAQTRMPNNLDGFSVWGQIYGSKDKSGENDLQIVNGFAVDADNKTDNTRYGVQLGVDFGIGNIGRIGLTGGLERAEVKGAAEVQLKGWNVGVYGQVGGALGFHGEAMFKHDRFDIDVDNGPFTGQESDGRSTGVDGAIGYRFPAGWVESIDLNVGLSHVWTKLDGIGGFGFVYDFERFNSTRARAGVRANLGGKYRPYLDVTGYREFDGDTDVNMFDGVNNYTISRDGKGSYVRFEGGLGGTGGFGPILAVWGDFGDRKGAGIRAGFRFGGARAQEALPPPPPPPPMAPPPPPPPPTQTCADGTVILASDVCPPPPPPPPPAPEPERG